MIVGEKDMEADLKEEWYGQEAKVVEQNKEYLVVDYDGQGRNMITSYFLFDGIRLCFLDFDTDEMIPVSKSDADVIWITHIQKGGYECEFANNTVSYLTEGFFGVAGKKYLPISFSIPLKRCQGISLVIDQQALSERTRKLMSEIPVDIDKIKGNLGIENRWYVDKTPEKIQQLFTQMYEGRGREAVGYFKLKVLELLYYIERSARMGGCELKYFDKEQIQKIKEIHNRLVDHPDEKVSLESLVKEAHLSITLFHNLFSRVYGDTPYAYLKKYKMNIAAKILMKEEQKISDIALGLGYSNASKFSKAFQSVYGVLPKDYRKANK